jgi:glyoxylase-like metal-dependent hydrolase (beta-lactamase superfamily II)
VTLSPGNHSDTQPRVSRLAGKISADSGLLWTEPGAWRVADGVHRIPLPLPMDGLRAVNVYVLETEAGLTLVDGGWAIEESRALLEESLASIGHGLGDITRFLVTHMHRDHYTQAVTVAREYGASVHLGLEEKHTLEVMQRVLDGTQDQDPIVGQLRLAGAHDVARQWASLFAERRPDDAMFAFPSDWLDGDHEIEVGTRTLDAVSTPGHTRGHFVFADRAAGLLFAGDHVLPHITPSIGFEPAPVEQPLRDFLGSLAKVRAMPDLTLLPAHGPIVDSSHGRIDELVDHHEHRLAQCLAAVGAGGSTAYDVARELPWTSRDTPYVDLDVFNAALAAMETMAHLQLLVARGLLTPSSGEGRAGARVYSRA